MTQSAACKSTAPAASAGQLSMAWRQEVRTPESPGSGDDASPARGRRFDCDRGRRAHQKPRHTRRWTMTKELGVWTYEDCALVLIDYQNEMFEVIRSETSADLIELNVRLLAKADTEICLTNATISALKAGYDAMFVTDAVGGRSQTAHRRAARGRVRRY